MKKLIVCLLIALLPSLAAAENCPVCGGTSDQCLTDELGAVYCLGTLVSYPEDASAVTYAVREGTRTIREYAFQSNEQLEEVILPEGVLMIDGSFSGCTNLRRVSLPESLLIIGDSAFYYCPKLADVTLPPHLYAIGPSAFADCWALTSIDIPETVGYIGSEAFCNTGLTEVWLRPVLFEYGFCVFTPDEQFAKAQPLTVHVSEAAEEEIGDVSNFWVNYEDGYNITFAADIPYEWE